MKRMTRADRRDAVLAAAADHVRSAQIEWASVLTFRELEVLTGIDQSQISRDFGSKAELRLSLVRHLLDPDSYERHTDHAEDWLLEQPAPGTSLGEILDVWAGANDELNRTNLLQLRSQMMLWASADVESSEWSELAAVYQRIHDDHVQVGEALIEGAVGNGAVHRGDLDAQAIVLTLSCLVEGLMIRAAVNPDMVPADMTARVARVLFSAAVGPSSVGPGAEMYEIEV